MAEMKVQAKGTAISVPAGGTTSTQISLNGLNGKMIGVSCINISTGSVITINSFAVNNDVIFDTVPAAQLERNASNPMPFTKISRSISGADSIKLVSSAPALSTYTFVLWYETN